MAFGSDFYGGNVSEMSTFYSGHYWPAACMDMNNNDDYAQDCITGKWPDIPNHMDVFQVALEAKL